MVAGKEEWKVTAKEEWMVEEKKKVVGKEEWWKEKKNGKGIEKGEIGKEFWTPATVCLRGESVLLACTHDPPQTKQAQTKTLTTSKNSCDKHIELFS